MTKIINKRGKTMDEKTTLIAKQKYMKTLMWIFIVLVAAIAYFSYILAQQLQNNKFYIGFIFIIPFTASAFYFRGQMLKYKALYFVKDIWGKDIKRKRNYDDIKKLYEYVKEEKSNAFIIDDQTFEDLTLEKVFEKIDRTLSSPGEQILYNILRKLEFDEEILSSRNKIINLFQSSKELREKIQIELYYLSRQRNNTITEFLWSDIKKNRKLGVLFNLMGIAPIVIILLIPFYGLSMVGYIIFSFFINMYIHFKFKSQISEHTDSMTYLSGVLNTAMKISEIDEDLLKEYKNIFIHNTKHIKASKTGGFLASIEGADPAGTGAILDYINILFLRKERKFYSILDELSKYRKEIKEVYIALGEIDALIAVASYRAGVKFYVEPKLTKGDRYIDIKDMVHPLIEDAVPNSISISNGGIVLTGSNMSGKSTFLRTLGINALLAQTICTCLAKEYKGSYFKILSSISPSDNLLTGKSYYLGEAEAVLRIIKSCDKDLPSLCIIDEIFRGTNPIERISASAEILDFLINNNALPVVATHDLELTEAVDKAYKCYYFTEQVTEDGLNFDYFIREGVSPTRNAIKLLKYLGYPEDIINKTYARIDTLFSK